MTPPTSTVVDGAEEGSTPDTTLRRTVWEESSVPITVNKHLLRYHGGDGV